MEPDMPRASNARIVGWGTPPEPEPTGWDAVRMELRDKPGKWANVGDYSPGSARKIAADKLHPKDGYETRTAPSKNAGRVDLWARYTDTPESPVETTEARPEAAADAADFAAGELIGNGERAPEKVSKARTVKRGGVV